MVHIAHDYVTQRGGAERVVLSLLDAFPGAELTTSIYAAESTFPQFRRVRIHKLWTDRVAGFRKDPKFAMPVLAAAFGFARKRPADVVICSSSGWAHGLRTDAAKIVYCHTPARWLYAEKDYLPEIPRALRLPARLMAFPALRRWDRRAARRADVYVANSTVVSERIRQAYGISARVVHPPVAIDVTGEQEPVAGVEPGYLLCVSRARGYKNVAAICQAVADLPGERLVVVGGVPDGAITGEGADRVQGVSRLSDGQMRWIYSHAAALIAVSREDFGLTPIEAYAFGTPAILLQAGGYLDSSIDGKTCVFIPSGDAAAIRGGIERFRASAFDSDVIREHAQSFAEPAFHAAMQGIVDEVAARSART
ncbi:MAG: glycosyltransferase [Dermatophilaceae bacterium]